MKSVKSWKNGQKYRNFLGKTDKDMIKRKIDRYLADFFKTDKKEDRKNYLSPYLHADVYPKGTESAYPIFH